MRGGGGFGSLGLWLAAGISHFFLAQRCNVKAAEQFPSPLIIVCDWPPEKFKQTRRLTQTNCHIRLEMNVCVCCLESRQSDYLRKRSGWLPCVLT